MPTAAVPKCRKRTRLDELNDVNTEALAVVDVADAITVLETDGVNTYVVLLDAEVVVVNVENIVLVLVCEEEVLLVDEDEIIEVTDDEAPSDAEAADVADALGVSDDVDVRDDVVDTDNNGS